MRALLRLAAVLAIVSLVSCASPPPPAQDLIASGALGFLSDGVTTREQATLRLGLPARTFEGDRILVYRMGWGEDGQLRSGNMTGSYDLVLVFDASDVLVRHALVEK
jgi:hypothetical protein